MADRRLLLTVSALGLAVAVALAAPVIGQPSPDTPVPASESDGAAPKSLLPEGFEPPPAPVTSAPLLPGTDTPPLVAPPLVGGDSNPTAANSVDPFAIAVPTGRDITVWGPLTPAMGGYGPAVFTGSRGPFLAGLMRRVNAPIGSRWASITLRRALMSESAAPAQIVAGDWVAARAWMLLRNGEVDGAKALIDPVPIDRYSPLLYKIAGQAALAAADIGGLCPIAVTGQLLSKDPLWPLAIGMCAAVQGDDITSASVFDGLRDDSVRIDPFDLRLGERVATIAGAGGRASNIDWAEAPRMTPYRYGVATAAGVAIPADRYAGLGPVYPGWIVRAPGVAPEVRLAAARQATVLGTMSATELASAVTALSTDTTPDGRAGKLRTAFVGTTVGNRLAALRDIWASGEGDAGRYGALLETATAAARLPVSADAADDAPQIIAALLAAGDTAAARRWWKVASDAGAKARAESWALLATGAGGVPVTPAEFTAWRSATSADERRAGLLLAGLAGLGLANGGEWSALKAELLPDAANSWTRAIDAAGAGGRLGEVTVLAATGLQGPWTDVPPLHLYHITAALSRAGRPGEARLIAAEALTRG